MDDVRLGYEDAATIKIALQVSLDYLHSLHGDEPVSVLPTGHRVMVDRMELALGRLTEEMN